MTDHERGTGLIATAGGVLVFLLFVLFAVQLLFSLYASSTVTAIVHDAAAQAATTADPDLDAIEREARARLGRVGDTATFTWSTEDLDGDGAVDSIALRVVATPPRLVPRSIGRGVGLGPIDRTATARVEALQP